MERDFTLDKYEILCKGLKEQNYNFYTILDAIESNPIPPFVVLRHDVDRSPSNALLMAKIENKLGIKSTYNFRIKGRLFDVPKMKEISSLGHEIGYHYEDLVTASGNIEKAGLSFEKNLKKFRSLGIKVKTATFHGSPFSRHDSRKMWDKFKFSNFGLSGLGYDSIDFSNIYYITDTGRTFAETAANIRDRPRTKYRSSHSIKSTNDILEFSKVHAPNFCIVTHPIRWSRGYVDWTWELLFQNTKNIGKKFLSLFR